MEQFKKRIPILSLLLREKKFLINKNFQIQFMISLMMISVTSMTVIYFANDYFFYSYMKMGQSLDLAPDHPFFLMIHEQKQFMLYVFVGVAACIAVIGAIWGLFYSHKIAGPLYRLERYFTQAALDNTGLNKKIYFRENDFFQEVPEAINRYIDTTVRAQAQDTNLATQARMDKIKDIA